MKDIYCTMNRAEKRLQARMAKHKPNRSRMQYNNILTLQNDCFDSLDRMFLSIRNGELRWNGKAYVIMGINGHDLHICSALSGWVYYWEELTDEMGVSYDGSAMKRLCKSLEYDKPLTLAEVDAAEEVLEVQRKLYRSIPQQKRREVYARVDAELKREGEIRELITRRAAA